MRDRLRREGAETYAVALIASALRISEPTIGLHIADVEKLALAAFFASR